MKIDNIQSEEMNPWKDINNTPQKMPAPSKRFPTPIEEEVLYEVVIDPAPRKIPQNFPAPIEGKKGNVILTSLQKTNS